MTLPSEPKLIAPELTSVSAARLFLLCPEKYRLQYMERLVPPHAAVSLQIGTRVHTGLELYYLAGGASKHGIDAVMAWLDEEEERTLNLTDLAQEDASLILANIRGMLTGYMAYAPKLDANIRIRKIEETQFFMGLQCKPDLLVTDTDGKLWVMDHKTTTLGHGLQYTVASKVDPQAAAYAAGCGAVGVFWNILYRTASRRRKTESHQEFCQRVIREYQEQPEKFFVRIRAELNDAERTAVHFIKSVQAQKQAMEQVAFQLGWSGQGTHWLRNAASCVAFGRICPYMPICSDVPHAEEMFVRKTYATEYSDEED